MMLGQSREYRGGFSMNEASFPRIAADELALAPFVENENQEYKAIGGVRAGIRSHQVILLNPR